MENNSPHITEFKTPPFVYLVASIGALGGLLFGFDTGIISGALIYINKTFSPSYVVQEIIVSSVVLGAFIGAIGSGRLADQFGRRTILILAAITFILSTLLATFAPNIDLLIAGRFMLGLAIGIASFVTPLYISEMSPARYRGALVLLTAIAITGGEAISYLINYALIPTQSWRLMFAVGIFPAVLLLIGMLKMPETPRWMVLNGFANRASEILYKIRNRKEAEAELNEIKHSDFLEPGTWREMFSKQLRPVLIIGLGLGILQQMVGINTVMYYGPIIFKHAGFQNPGTELLATFSMGLVNTLASVLAVLIVDRVGRRKLLLIGTLVAALSLMFVGIAFIIGTHSVVAHWTAFISMLIYIIGYSLSLGSMFWLVISEIYPLNIRGLAMSFTAGIQWFANFIVASTFLSILSAIGSADTFWLYGIISGISFFFCYYLVPETTGVSLEEIEHNLTKGKPSRELGQPLQTSFRKFSLEEEI